MIPKMDAKTSSSLGMQSRLLIDRVIPESLLSSSGVLSIVRRFFPETLSNLSTVSPSLTGLPEVDCNAKSFGTSETSVGAKSNVSGAGNSEVGEFMVPK